MRTRLAVEEEPKSAMREGAVSFLLRALPGKGGDDVW